MKFTITSDIKSTILTDLKVANLAYYNIYKGDSPERQPVHTCLLYTSDAADERLV